MELIIGIGIVLFVYRKEKIFGKICGIFAFFIGWYGTDYLLGG